MKNWGNNDIYNFSIEFNRIEKYNNYCVEWLKYYGSIVEINSKTDWNYNDIPDINDYNRIKGNINKIIDALSLSVNNLNISTQFNQQFNYSKANEMENALGESLKFLGEKQFAYQITGLAIVGNNLKLGGVK